MSKTTPNSRPKFAKESLLESTSRPSLGIMALEPRVLLDGAGIVTGAEAMADAAGHIDAALSPEQMFFNAPSVMDFSRAEEADTAHSGLLSALTDKSVSFMGPMRANGVAGDPVVDLNGTGDPGYDFETSFQPTTGNIFPIVDFDISVTTDSGMVDSLSISFAGIVDTGSELAYHSGPAGGTAFFLTPGIQTEVVSLDAAGTVQLQVNRNGLDFTITGLGGAATSDVNIQTFMSQFLFGDLAPVATEGPRTATFTVDDGGATSEAVATINVHYFPTAGNDVNSVVANSPTAVTGNVLSNDTDATSGDVLSVLEVDSYPGAVGQAYVSTYGTLTLNSDGTYAYQVDINNATVVGLKSGANVTDIIAYTVSDQVGNTDTAFITVTINGVDEVPIATDNTNTVVRTQQPTATGSVLYDDDGFGLDSGDRPFSQLIWENQFSSEQAVDGASMVIDGVTVSLTASDPQNNAGNGNHQVSYGTNGGHTGYLRFTASAGEATNTPHEMNVAFDNPVTNLAFTLADLDWSQATSWQDQFTIIGLLDGEEVDLSAQVSGTVVQVGDNTFYGTGSVPNTEAHGNVNVLFTTPVDEVRILYNYGPDATVRDGFQIGALSDLSWQSTGVPRVSEVGGNTSGVGNQVAGQYGFFTINGDGSYTYEIDPANTDVIALAGSAVLTDSIQYTLIDTVDGSGNTDTANLTVTISAPNSAPVAENDAVGGAENATTIFDVFADNGIDVDSDPEGDSFIITRAASGNDEATLAPLANGTGLSGTIAGSAGGSFSVLANGTVQFNPGTDFDDLAVGETRVTEIVYQIEDSAGGTDTAVVTYTVTGENDAIVPVIPGNPATPGDRTDFIPPQTGVDNVAIATPLDLNTFFDDPDTNDVVTFSANAGDLPLGLTLTNGVISGTPDKSASQGGTGGVYDIPVTVTDSNGDSFVTTVTYTIENPVPTAQDNVATAVEDATAPATGNVITDNDPTDGLDTDPDGDVLTVTDVDGSAVTPTTPATVIGTYGTLTLNSDGSYSYATDNGNVDVQALATGETLTETFTYTIDDGEGGTDAADLVVTIEGANDPVTPVIPGDPNPPADPNAYISAQTGVDSSAITDFDITPYFTDADTNDVVTLSIDPADLPGGLTFDGTSITGTPDADASQGGTNGVYTIPVTATDGNGSTFATNVTYTINNPAPVAQDDALTTDEDTTITGSAFAENGSGLDVDPDGDVITVSEVGGLPANVGMAIAGSGGGEFTVNPDGSYTFNPNGEFEGLDIGESAVSTVTYQISDGEGGTSDATITVTVSGVNDAPIVTGTLTGQPGTDSVTQTPLDTSVVFDDVDGETLTFTSPDIPSWMSLNPATGEITGTPPADASQGGANSDGEYIVTVVATDPDGTSVSTTVTYTFTNPAPVVDIPVVAETAVDSEVISILPDFSDPDGDDLTYTVTGLPTGLSINSMTGEITGTLDNSASQHGPSSDGIYTIAVTADDGEGGTVTDTFTLTVTNPEPIAQDDALTADEDTAINGSVFDNNGSGLDTDPDGDDITVTQVNGLPANVGMPIAGSDGGLFTINPDGTYTFDPNGDFAGLDISEDQTTTVTYLIDDGEGGTDMATVTVTVKGVNDAPNPIIPGDPNPPADNQDYLPEQLGNDSETLTPFDVSVYFDDVDGEVNFFTATDLPSWMGINPFTGVITGTPPADASQGGPNGDGTYPITITATDPDGETFSTIVDYTIANPAPTAIDDAEVTDEDTILSDNVLPDNGTGEDFDVDGDAIFITQVDGTDITSGSVITLPSGALLTMNTDGSYDYDPNNSFESLAVGETGSDSFTYTLSDGEGGIDVAIVVITIEGVNDAPIPVDITQPLLPNDPQTPTDPDDPRTPPVDPQDYIPAQTGSDGEVSPDLDLTPYFGDPDGTDSVTLSLDPADLPVGLTFDGATISGTPDADASQNGTDPLVPGVYEIPVTATDPSGESFTTIVTYTIDNPPPVAQDDAVTGNEDTSVTFSVYDANVTTMDIDPDGDVITVTRVLTGSDEALLAPITDGTGVATPVTGTNGGTFTVQPDGTTVFDPAGDFEDLAAGETRTTQIVYQINDGQGGTDTAVVTYTVEGVNDAPIPVDPTQPTGQPDPNDPVDPSDPRVPPVDPQDYIPSQTGLDDSPVTPLDLTPYFGDPDGTDNVVLTIDPSDLPVGLTFDGTTISGTPDNSASQTGSDPLVPGVYEIPVTATDASGAEFTTIVTYTIENPAPVVDTPIGPQATVDDATVSIPSAFSDPDGDDLTYTVTGLPVGLDINPLTGEISGTVDNSASQFGPSGDGVYTVTVTADDGEGGTVTETFELTVTNPAPDAVDDFDIGNEDVSVIGNVITPNDSDPDGDDLVVSQVGGLEANVSAPIAGDNGGLFTINPDGSHTFDPNGDFEGLDVGETAMTSVTYQISDGEGGFDTATLEITVEGENDTPEVIDPNIPGTPPADPNAVIPQQPGDDSAPVTPLDVTPYFTDIDVEPLTYGLDNPPSWLSINPVTGVITGTPPADASQNGPNSDGVYPVTVTATDPDGTTVTTVVAFAIENPAPIAVNDDYTTAEDTPIMVNILTDNDSDPDGDDLFIDAVALPDGTVIEIGVPTQIAQGVLTVNADGSTTFEPALNVFGPVVFGYTISDGEGGTDVATVTIDVTPVNDAPISVDPTQPDVPTDPTDPNFPDYPTDPEDPRQEPFDPNAYIPEQPGNDSEPLPPLDLTPYFGDPDPMEPLTITVADNELPPGVTFDPLTNTLSGTPDPDASQGGDDGVYEVEVTATDPAGLSFTTTVTYTISNPPPVASPDGPLPIVEDTPTVIDPLGNDNDPDGDDLTITEINGTPITAGAPTELPSGAIVTLNPNGTITYEPVLNYNGPDSFEYTIDDGEGGTDTATVTLDVTPVNDAPEVTPATPSEAALPPRDNLDGDIVSVDVSGPFSDIDGDPLTFTATGLPNGLTIDPDAGVITGTLPPGTSADGPFNVVITATDPGGLSVSTPFVWTVTNIAPEVVTELPPVTVNDSDLVSIPTASSFDDPDGDPVTYTADDLPPGLTIDPQTGIISGTLDSSESLNGPFDITVIITDSQGERASSTFTLTVDNPAPVITPMEPMPPIVSGEPIVINVGDNTDDPDGDEQLVYSAPELPPGLTLDPQTGIITGTPTVPKDTPYVFDVIVDDGEGGVTSTTISLQVNEDGYVPLVDPSDRSGLHTPHDPMGRDYARPTTLERLFAEDGFKSLRDSLNIENRDFWGGMEAVAVNEYGDCAFIGMEAVAYAHSVNVTLSETIISVCAAKVVSWDVDYARAGGSLPAWIDHADGSDMIVLNRTVADETAVLHIRALLDDGRSVNMTVEVDMATGAVEQVGQSYARAATLAEQFAIAEAQENSTDKALLMALAG